MRDEIGSKVATDDERREVAERLWEFTKDNHWPLTVGGNSSTIRYAISDIVFGDKKYHSGVDLLDRLADLIEPSCDRDALLALADKVVADTEEDVRSEDLVPAWQAGEALRDVASKIREALGVVG